MGPRCGGDAARPSGVFRGIPEGERSLRRAGGGLPAGLHEPERALEAGRSGDGAAVGSGGPVALCAHHGAARRRGEPCASGDGQDRERGFGPARSGADRGGGRHIVASGPSRRHGPSAFERAVGSRLRHHDQAALRPPGGGGGELQPEEAGPSLARLPRVPDGGHAAGSGCRGGAGQPSPFEPGGAVAVGPARPSRSGSLAAPGAGRQGLGQRGQHGVVRGGGSGLSVQAAPDQGGAPSCRAADGAGRMGG